MFLNQLFSWFKKCPHPKEFIEFRKVIQTGEMTEPGMPSRTIKIRMLNITCKKCGKMILTMPKGIVEDSSKGIVMNSEEKEDEILDIMLTNDGRKEIDQWRDKLAMGVAL